MRSPTSTSLGHFRPSSRPDRRASGLTTASPASSGSQPQPSRGNGGRSSTETASPERSGACQVRSARPRPAVCSSATTTSPSAAPARAAAATSALVDPVSATTRRSVQSESPDTSAARSAASRSGGRSRSRQGLVTSNRQTLARGCLQESIRRRGKSIKAHAVRPVRAAPPTRGTHDEPAPALPLVCSHLLAGVLVIAATTAPSRLVPPAPDQHGGRRRSPHHLGVLRGAPPGAARRRSDRLAAGDRSARCGCGTTRSPGARSRSRPASSTGPGSTPRWPRPAPTAPRCCWCSARRRSSTPPTRRPRARYGPGASAMPTQAAWVRYVQETARRNLTVWGHVASFQVWNEANVVQLLVGDREADGDADRLDPQRPARGGPSARLVAPALVSRLSSQQTWIKAFYSQKVAKKNVSAYVDALSFQLYPTATGSPEASMALLASDPQDPGHVPDRQADLEHRGELRDGRRRCRPAQSDLDRAPGRQRRCAPSCSTRRTGSAASTGTPGTCSAMSNTPTGRGRPDHAHPGRSGVQHHPRLAARRPPGRAARGPRRTPGPAPSPPRRRPAGSCGTRAGRSP